MIKIHPGRNFSNTGIWPTAHAQIYHLNYVTQIHTVAGPGMPTTAQFSVQPIHSDQAGTKKYLIGFECPGPL
jgi:hypothetical protein